MKSIFTCLFILIGLNLYSQEIDSEISRAAEDLEEKVIEWRRNIHQNPELSNREFKTAKKVAEHLKSLGIEVQIEVAHTGVVGILKGDNEGKTVALRADMDALPVTERSDLPFKSEVVTEFMGEKTGVMHACGHDTHVAILMGVAEVLANNKDKINGTIKFIFQPAEEGAPEGEEGGASLMIKEGVLKNPDVDAIFGLHINSETPVNTIKYTPEGMMAAVEEFKIKVEGKQTHGSQPWSGVDPIFISAKIIDGLQSIISRESKLLDGAAVITVGKINSGVRFNIIPETAEMVGTIRSLDADMKELLLRRINKMVPAIAEAYGGKASIEIKNMTSITYNNPELTDKMLPTLQKTAGKENVKLMKPTTGGEDFSFFQEEVPGLFFYLGGMPEDNKEAAPHHTPDFYIDESGMLLGVKTLSQLALDYLNQ